MIRVHYIFGLSQKSVNLPCIFRPHKLLFRILHFFHAFHLDVSYTFPGDFCFLYFFFFFYLPTDTWLFLTKFTRDLLQIRKRFSTRKTPRQLNIFQPNIDMLLIIIKQTKIRLTVQNQNIRKVNATDKK